MRLGWASSQTDTFLAVCFERLDWIGFHLYFVKSGERWRKVVSLSHLPVSLSQPAPPFLPFNVVVSC